MAEPVIVLEGIRKSFRINVDSGANKKRFARREMEEFVVFDNVNLKVYEGEVLGILGRNGAGKSTFLKIISQIIEPDCGTVDIRKKVASILELSIGFHNDLTGRENIFLRSELYGIPRKDVYNYLDSVIEYSDLGKFIDNPVRTYSSGMKARLAFSIMVNVDADIFLVDEALSTGDAAFASKASEHLKDLVRRGKTVLMTSHNIRAIRNTCDRAIWLSEKSIFMDGPVEQVCDAYTRSIMESFEETYKLAKGGSSAAQYRLAGFYRHGVHVEPDQEQYIHWIREAAIRGHVPAMSEYAEHLISEDPEGNREVALDYYKDAAIGGNYDARKRYAYLRGKVDEEARFLRSIMEKVAESGYPTDVAMYAAVVNFGAMNDQDRKLAYNLYCVAADKGNAEALYRKGTMLRAGVGTERSIPCAIKAFEEAAELGHLKAMLALAELYEDGRMVEQDMGKAFHWYMESAIAGSSRSQYVVAMMLSLGSGVDVDNDAADEWFRMNAGSYLNEARTYAVRALQKRKIGSRADINRLLKAASDCGFNRATTRLADLKFRGYGASKDIDGAMELYELAAKRSVLSRANLADAIMANDPDEEDKLRSFNLFMQAANNGDAYAMYAVACMYRDGSGVPLDRELYKQYTYMAADAGNKDAMQVVSKWKMKERKRQKKETSQTE